MFFLRFLFVITVFTNIGLFIYNRQNTPQAMEFLPVDYGVEKLQLISELDEDESLWEQSDTTQVVSRPVFNQVCFSIGVFNAQSEVKPIRDILKNKVIKIRTRKVISTQEAGFWVYIPAKKSRQEALEIARKLSSMEIKDYYVVTGGENENTISLGLFRDRQNADTRLQELIDRGFSAEKQIRIEQWPEFWLDYAIASDQSEGLIDLQQLNPDASINKVACNW